MSSACLLPFSSGPRNATNSVCQSKDVSDASDLATFFQIVLVVDANGVNPQRSRLIRISKMKQRGNEGFPQQQSSGYAF